jgi:hypothetical protein
MTHEVRDENDGRFTDIVARDEAEPGIGQQIVNGISGLLMLLVTGIAVMLLVLWKAP